MRYAIRQSIGGNPGRPSPGRSEGGPRTTRSLKRAMRWFAGNTKFSDVMPGERHRVVYEVVAIPDDALPGEKWMVIASTDRYGERVSPGGIG